MAVTGAIFRGLIFDGINSKDYGIYITGTGVYNAPERDVTMVSIPGRNGDLAIDNGRFNNIEVTYHCGTFGDSQEDFAEGISRFRNALCSRQGYVRITDDYNSGEYRLGIYKHGLDVDAEAVKGGEFDIVFDCKPQRYLIGGDLPIEINGTPGSKKTSGASYLATVESDGGDEVTMALVDITEKQAGTGTPSLGNIRPFVHKETVSVAVSGANFVNNYERQLTHSGVTFWFYGDGRVFANGHATETAIVTCRYVKDSLLLPVGVELTISGGSSNIGVMACWYEADGVTQTSEISHGSAVKVTIPETALASWCRVIVANGTTLSNELVVPVVTSGAATSGHKAKTYTVSLGASVTDADVGMSSGEAYIHRMYAKWGEGVLANKEPESLGIQGPNTTFRIFVNANKLSTGGAVNCDRLQSLSQDDYSNPYKQGIGNSSDGYVWVKLETSKVGDSAESVKAWLDANPIEITYPVNQLITFTKPGVALEAGKNYIWSNVGTVNIGWRKAADILANPTMFDAKPLLSFEGIGNIGIGNKTIMVKDVLLGWITIANGAPGESMDLSVVDTSYPLDMSNVNTGDTIMAGDYKNGNIGNFLAITRVKNMPAFDSVRTTKSGDYYIDTSAKKTSSSEIQTGVSFSNVVFTAGTSADLSATAKIEFYSGSTRVGVVQWDTQVHYDGSNTVRVIAQIATDAKLYKKYELSVPKTRANSTKSTLTGTTYIDLDVAEAWMVKNGKVIVSANDHVVLGAEPPVLPPGATRITYNGTITNLKITPRWWRV